MKRRIAALVCLALLLTTSVGVALFKPKSPAVSLTAAAQEYVSTLDEKEQATSMKEYESPERVGWHFIPKDERKGLQFKHMNKKQRKAALSLLKASLSKIGYGKAEQIMQLEGVLHALEGGKGRNIRDTERYYFTLFGKPDSDNRWGLSIEGHHLSLNFVVEGEEIVSSTPSFFAANPATMMSEVKGTGIAKGTRVLADEEQLAFELVNALSEEQQGVAILAPKAPREIRAAGEAQPPQSEPEGISAGKLTGPQKKTLQALIEAYAKNMTSDVATSRLAAIDKAGIDKIYFAWAGATKPGVGHYYRIQGPSFLIEFVNTQPDPAGNPANHIHCVWRDPHGDFAIPIK